MENKPQYFGSLTREQFLYYENRIVAKLILQGKTYEEILKTLNPIWLLLPILSVKPSKVVSLWLGTTQKDNSDPAV